MLVKAFDSPYFDPCGIRLKSNPDDGEFTREGGFGTFIIFGKHQEYNENRGHVNAPQDKYHTVTDCIYIDQKRTDEVAEEINRQIVLTRRKYEQ